jgi:hypothetical protein
LAYSKDLGSGAAVGNHAIETIPGFFAEGLRAILPGASE